MRGRCWAGGAGAPFGGGSSGCRPGAGGACPALFLPLVPAAGAAPVPPAARGRLPEQRELRGAAHVAVHAMTRPRPIKPSDRPVVPAAVAALVPGPAPPVAEPPHVRRAASSALHAMTVRHPIKARAAPGPGCSDSRRPGCGIPRCGVFVPSYVIHRMADYSAEIDRCRRTGEPAERTGHAEPAELPKDPVKPCRGRPDDPRDWQRHARIGGMPSLQ